MTDLSWKTIGKKISSLNKKKSFYLTPIWEFKLVFLFTKYLSWESLPSFVHMLFLNKYKRKNFYVLYIEKNWKVLKDYLIHGLTKGDIEEQYSKIKKFLLENSTNSSKIELEILNTAELKIEGKKPKTLSGLKENFEEGKLSYSEMENIINNSKDFRMLNFIAKLPFLTEEQQIKLFSKGNTRIQKNILNHYSVSSNLLQRALLNPELKPYALRNPNVDNSLLEMEINNYKKWETPPEMMYGVMQNKNVTGRALFKLFDKFDNEEKVLFRRNLKSKNISILESSSLLEEALWDLNSALTILKRDPFNYDVYKNYIVSYISSLSLGNRFLVYSAILNNKNKLDEKIIKDIKLQFNTDQKQVENWEIENKKEKELADLLITILKGKLDKPNSNENLETYSTTFKDFSGKNSVNLYELENSISSRILNWEAKIWFKFKFQDEEIKAVHTKWFSKKGLPLEIYIEKNKKSFDPAYILFNKNKLFEHQFSKKDFIGKLKKYIKVTNEKPEIKDDNKISKLSTVELSSYDKDEIEKELKLKILKLNGFKSEQDYWDLKFTIENLQDKYKEMSYFMLRQVLINKQKPFIIGDNKYHMLISSGNFERDIIVEKLANEPEKLNKLFKKKLAVDKGFLNLLKSSEESGISEFILKYSKHSSQFLRSINQFTKNMLVSFEQEEDYSQMNKEKLARKFDMLKRLIQFFEAKSSWLSKKLIQMGWLENYSISGWGLRTDFYPNPNVEAKLKNIFNKKKIEFISFLENLIKDKKFIETNKITNEEIESYKNWDYYTVRFKNDSSDEDFKKRMKAARSFNKKIKAYLTDNNKNELLTFFENKLYGVQDDEIYSEEFSQNPRVYGSLRNLNIQIPELEDRKKELIQSAISDVRNGERDLKQIALWVENMKHEKLF